MNILITGGAGFIGSHTTRALAAQGHKVRILDCLDPQIHGETRVFTEELSSLAECVRGDVCVEADCRNALRGIEVVYHLAARTGVGQSMYDISDYVKTNVLGTTVLVESIVKMRLPLKRFVLSSSRAVYGEGLFKCDVHGPIHPGPRDPTALQAGDFQVHCPHCGTTMTPLPTPTDCAKEPLSVYAMTKLQQEDYCQFAMRIFSLPLVVLRYFNVYGSLQSLRNPYTGVISIFYSLIREGASLSLYERGLPVRDFVHVSDVAQANLLALNPGLAAGEVFNVGSGRAHTIVDIARAEGAALGLKPNLVDSGEYRIGDIFGCYADLTRSREVLEFSPRYDLASGMIEFASWARQQTSENRYERTVQELMAHGLFGRAEQ